MKKFEVFDMLRDHLSAAWKYNMLTGLFFIAFGIVVLVAPYILVALISSFFIFCGAFFLVLARKGKKGQKEYYDTIRINIDDVF